MQMTDQDGAGLTAGTSVFKRTGGRADHRGSTAGCSAFGPTTGLLSSLLLEGEGRVKVRAQGILSTSAEKGLHGRLSRSPRFVSPRVLRASLGRNERLGGVGINNRMRKFA